MPVKFVKEADEEKVNKALDELRNGGNEIVSIHPAIAYQNDVVSTTVILVYKPSGKGGFGALLDMLMGNK